MSKSNELLDISFIQEKSILFLKEKKIEVIPDSFDIKSDSIEGLEGNYEVILFDTCDHKKVKIAFDKDKNEVIYHNVDEPKEKEIENETKKGSHPFINLSTISFLIIVALIYSFTKLSFFGNALLLAIPLFFGFLLYFMAYKQAKDYLKKITDTITLASSLISLLAIIYGINIGKFLFDTHQNIILRTCLFVVIQSFSIFATLKLIIAFRETLDERKKYYKSFNVDDKNKEKVTPNFFKRQAINFSSAFYFGKTRLCSAYAKISKPIIIAVKKLFTLFKSDKK
jgi:hypothetical protein